jgi:uncharacterized integral membrane protein
MNVWQMFTGFEGWVFYLNSPWSVPLGIGQIVAFIAYAPIYAGARVESFDPFSKPMTVGDLIGFVVFAPLIVCELLFVLMGRVFRYRLDAVKVPTLPKKVCPHCHEVCWGVKSGCQKRLVRR